MKKLEEIWRKIILKFLSIVISSKKLNPDSLDINSIKRILIVRQHNEIGDMLLATPLFSAIREKLPDSFISLIARQRNIDVVLNNPDLNEIILFDIKKYRSNPWKFFKFLFDLRKKRYDLSIVPCTVSFSLTSAILSYLSGAKYRIGTDGNFFGFYKESSFFFNIYVPVVQNKHQVDINLDFVRMFRIDNIDRRNKMRLLKEEEEYAKRLLKKIVKNNESNIIGVHPGGGKEQNRWQPSRFGELIDNILKYNFGSSRIELSRIINVLLMYGPGEDKIVKEVLDACHCELCEHGNLIIIPVVDLRTLAGIIKQCKLFICNDTGVLHIAAGIGIPTIAIFGPSNPDYWNPAGEEHIAVRGKDFNVNSVLVSEVFEKVQIILENQRNM